MGGHKNDWDKDWIYILFGRIRKFRSTEVLKYLADEVEEYTDHFVIKYSEDKDFVIYQFLVLLWENNIIVSTW